MDRPDLAPQLKFLTVPGPSAQGGGPRRMAWWDWPCAGRQDHIVVCVHGLSRQGRDFDALARRLAPQARVVAVDVAGRGHSDWLADPMAYQVGTYAADLAALIVHLRQDTPAARIDWVGTSMGGLIGTYVSIAGASGPRERALTIRFAAACWLWLAAVMALILLLPRPWGQLLIPLGPAPTLAVPWCNRKLAAARALDEASPESPPA